MVSDEPMGWPGVIHREGRTVMRVAEKPMEGRRGPAAKGAGAFLNPAMAAVGPEVFSYYNMQSKAGF